MRFKSNSFLRKTTIKIASFINRKLVSNIIYFTVFFLNRKKSARILMYHSVHIEKELNGFLSVFPEDFERQVEFLKKEGYVSVTLSGLLQAIKKGKTTDNMICITFDDAYSDVYQYAYPVMEKYGFKGTVFVLADYINTNKIFPWDSRDHGIAQSMNEEEIKQLINANWEIGSHSLSHPMLPLIKNEEQLKGEILSSKKKLEKIFNKDINTFCYPCGLFTEQIWKTVQKSDYHCACTTSPGKLNKLQNLYLLPRTEISGRDTFLDFKKKILGIYDFIHIPWQYIRKFLWRLGVFPFPHEE